MSASIKTTQESDVPHWIPYLQFKKTDDVIKQSQSSFFSSFRFLSQNKADAMKALYVFFRIADDCVDELSDPSQQSQALHYWREQLKLTQNKQKAHPIMEEVRAVLTQFAIPDDYLFGLLEGCEQDITQKRYQTFDDLLSYCYKVASLVGLSCLKIFGYSSPTAETMAIHLGYAFQLTNIMRDVKEDAERGRIYLAQNDLKTFKVNETTLLQGQDSPQLQELLKDYGRKAESFYQSAFEEFKKDSKDQLVAARIMSKVYFHLFKKMKAHHFNVMKTPLKLSKFEKITLLLPELIKLFFRGPC